MSPEQIRLEVERLARASAWPGMPGGWQYPIDFGHGVVAPTYTPVQTELHPWRRRVLLDNLEPIFSDRFNTISVLDLGACEGGIAAGLVERGVRDITCVEGRPINVEKLRFVNSVKNYGIKVVEADVEEYLRAETRCYDLVLFMGILYHLTNPFPISHEVARVTKEVACYETTVALSDPMFSNVDHYKPESAGFFIRRDSVLSNTAGLHDFELWPNMAALFMLLEYSGFKSHKILNYGADPVHWYKSGQRTMLFAYK